MSWCAPSLVSWCAPSAWDAGIEARLRRTVEPEDLPINVADIKRVLRVVSDDAEDPEIESWIWGGVSDCEAYGIGLGVPKRAVIPQTWELLLSGFPHTQRIPLPVAPVISVTSIAYIDGAGDPQDLATSPMGFLLLPSGPYAAAEIRPLPGQSFPATSSRPDAVTVTFVAGYADSTSPALKHVISGIGLFVGEMYRQRTLQAEGRLSNSTLQLERFWGGPF